METKKETEAAGKDEAKLMEMVTMVNQMVIPVLERSSLERFATAAMQGLLEGDVVAGAGNPASLAAGAWDIAEAMMLERNRRAEAEAEVILRELAKQEGQIVGSATGEVVQ